MVQVQIAAEVSTFEARMEKQFYPTTVVRRTSNTKLSVTNYVWRTETMYRFANQIYY